MYVAIVKNIILNINLRAVIVLVDLFIFIAEFFSNIICEREN